MRSMEKSFPDPEDLFQVLTSVLLVILNMKVITLTMIEHDEPYLALMVHLFW